MGKVHFFIVVSCAVAIMIPVFDISAALQDEIEARNQQIEQLQKQIDEYQQLIDQNSSKAKTLSSEISRLNARIGQVQLEIKGLNLVINQTDSEIQQAQAGILSAEEKLDLHRAALTRYIRILEQADKETLTEVLFKNGRLSEFFGSLKNLEDTQNNLKDTIVDIKGLKTDLEERKEQLGDKLTELEKLNNLQQQQKRIFDQEKSAKDRLLKDTKGQEAKFQELVKKSQKDIAVIRAQVTYLQQNGVSVEDAIKYGQLAAIGTGIRPAFLIAVLEVESGLGRNVGRCNREGDPPFKGWQVIMHTRDHQPFALITSALGLNINATTVSCPQFVNGRQYGWGGAMGPAQFIPSTWMGYKDEVARLTGRNPANPWNIEDAFTASALKLAKGGATSKTRAGEVAAAKAYYSGRSTCSTAPCNSYANAVLSKAAIIEQNL